MEADKEVTKTIDVRRIIIIKLKGKICVLQLNFMRIKNNSMVNMILSVNMKWSCEAPDKDLYCMTVHSCSADDGHGMGQQLVDEKG
uniref:ZP domain-containing protein n=1 Tax=Heterorhabditis bacteriophora TaxID=37862 RepID=A0A1I7XI56_HETBA